MIVENAKIKALSDDLKGLFGPRSRNSFPANASIMRSMH